MALVIRCCSVRLDFSFPPVRAKATTSQDLCIAAWARMSLLIMWKRVGPHIAILDNPRVILFSYFVISCFGHFFSVFFIFEVLGEIEIQ